MATPFAALVGVLAMPAWAAAEAWTAPFQPAGTNLVSEPLILLGPGQVLEAVWRDASGIHASERPPGGTFPATATAVPGTDLNTSAMAAAISATGELTVAWRQTTVGPPPGGELHIARRAPGATSFEEVPPSGGERPTVSNARLLVAYDGVGRSHVGFADAEGRVAVADVGATSFTTDTGAPIATPLATGAAVTSLRVSDLAAAPDGAVAVCWVDATSTASCARRVGTTWGPAMLGTTDAKAPDPRAAFGPAGELLVAAQHRDASTGAIAFAFVTAAGTRTGSIAVPASAVALPLDVAVDGAGRAVVVWQGTDPTGTQPTGLMVSSADPEASVPPTVVDDTAQPVDSGSVRVERVGDGGVVAVYTAGTELRSVRRGLDESGFGTPQQAAQGSNATAVSGLEISPAPETSGELAASWETLSRDSGVTPVVQLPMTGGFAGSVLDRTGPAFAATFPEAGDVGEPLAFAAGTPLDAWSPLAGDVSWDFGDGTAPATGPVQTHAYSARGTYLASASAADSAGNTSRQSGPVEVGLRSIEVPSGGSGGQAPAATPSEPPPPEDRPAPQAQTAQSETPVEGSGNLERVSGSVLVKRPGTVRFVRVQGSTRIAVGTLVDATGGTVHLTVARDTRGHTQTGEFSGGVFEYTQHLADGPPVNVLPAATTSAVKDQIITDLTLAGPTFASCPVASAARRAQGSRRRVVRYLRAKAHGTFRVVGRSASGIERGTAWTTTDTCAATEVRVSEGAVDVEDIVRLRRVTVEAGDSYTAPHAPGIAGVTSHTPDRASLLAHGLRFRQVFPGPGRASWRIDVSVWDRPTVQVARRRDAPIPPPVRVGGTKLNVRLPGSQEIAVPLTAAGRRLVQRHPHARLVFRRSFAPRAGGPRRIDVLAPLPL